PALYDPNGHPVIIASEATWDRTLGQFLSGQPRRGTFALRGASLDIEHRGDGSIDLIEALRPILRPNKATDLTIQVTGDSLQFRSPYLSQPIQTGRAELTIRIPPAPDALAWHLHLGDDSRPADGV